MIHLPHHHTGWPDSKSWHCSPHAMKSGLSPQSEHSSWLKHFATNPDLNNAGPWFWKGVWVWCSVCLLRDIWSCTLFQMLSLSNCSISLQTTSLHFSLWKWQGGFCTSMHFAGHPKTLFLLFERKPFEASLNIDFPCCHHFSWFNTLQNPCTCHQSVLKCPLTCL